MYPWGPPGKGIMHLRGYGNDDMCEVLQVLAILIGYYVGMCTTLVHSCAE